MEYLFVCRRFFPIPLLSRWYVFGVCKHASLQKYCSGKIKMLLPFTSTIDWDLTVLMICLSRFIITCRISFSCSLNDQVCRWRWLLAFVLKGFLRIKYTTQTGAISLFIFQQKVKKNARKLLRK